MINVFQPSLGKEELDALQQVFESNWIGRGKKVVEFEEKYAEHIKSSKDLVLTTTCCSEGLFSSMHLLDIQCSWCQDGALRCGPSHAECPCRRY